MIGTTRSFSSNSHLSKFTSTYSSGTDSKNMAVDMCNPTFSIPMPADTLNWEGIKAPTPLVNGCSLISAMSCSEKVLLFPTKEPNVLTFLLTIT